MLKRHLSLAYRRLIADKLTGIVNIVGLSIGISASIVILQFVIHELSFDKFHTNADRVFAISAVMKFGGNETTTRKMSAQFGPAVREGSADVIDFFRIKTNKKASISTDRQHLYYEDRFIFADPSFLSMLSFKLLQGDLSTALVRPNSVVITPTIARKYFGEEPPLGKTLRYNGQIEFEVTGVIQTAPSNSSIQYDFIASFATVPQVERLDYPQISAEDIPYNASYVAAGAYETFVLLSTASENIKDRVEKILPVLVKQSGMHVEDDTYYLQPLTALNASVSIISKYRFILLSIGLLILVLALLNFISLSATKSIQRSKEAGIKKVFGAQVRDLALQLYVETGLTVTIAFALSLVFIEISRSALLEIIGIRIDSNMLFNPWTIVASLLVLIVSGVIAGSYPSFVFAAIRPLEAFRGKVTSRATGIQVQRYFITFQFTITIILIACMTVAFHQANFLRKHDLGLNKSNVVCIPIASGTASGDYNGFRDAALNLSGVRSVAAASIPLFKSYTSAWAAKSTVDRHDITVCSMSISDNFIPTFDLHWAMRPESSSQLFGPHNVILNEEAVRQLQLGADPINKTFKISNETLTVAGVLKDFNFSSLHRRIEPLMIEVIKDTVNPFASGDGSLYIKLQPKADLESVLYQIQGSFNAHIKDKPFDYYFLDEAVQANYVDEMKTSRLLTISAVLAILLASIGLFAFCNLVIASKTREIGIRKTLGATVLDIVQGLILRFISPLAFAILIGIPASWYLMHQWLQKYPYKAGLSFTMFIGVGIFILVIAMTTVFVKSLRAAMMNPVKTIRNE